MAHLEKLLIMGFRSFGPNDEDRQIMNFISKGGGDAQAVCVWPLTLILGQNGCGKTTIIECLRYVTTGDCPPGSHSGRSFVHDPKMSRETSVRGTVKLQFRGTDGKQYLISRTMEATQKAKQISVKTLDGTFKRCADNTSLSAKCADINSTMLDHLGVSKPILNYVIFCHQEDSNWPLDEGSKVKDKFDEIFASAKYKDCLKKIKDVRADHVSELRRDKDNLVYLKEDKNTLNEKRKDLKSKEKNRDDLTEEIEEATQQLQPLHEELTEIREAEINFSGIMEKKTQAKTRKEQAQQVMDELLGSLDYEFDEKMTDGEIARMQRDVERETERKTEESEQKRTELKALADKIREDGENLRVMSAQLGETKQAQKTHQANQRALKDMVEDVGQKLSWDDAETQATDSLLEGDEDAMETVMKRMKKAVGSCERKARKVAQEMDAKIDAQNGEVNGLEKRLALLDDQKRRAQTGLIEQKREIAEIKAKLRANEESVEKLQDIQKAYSKKEGELTSARESVNLDELRQTVRAKKDDLAKFERRDAELREEKSLLDAHQKVLTEISNKKEDRDDKEAKLERLLAKTRRRLDDVFDDRVPEVGQLRERFNLSTEMVESERKAADKDVQKMRHDRETKKEKRRTLQKDINVKEDRIKRIKNELTDLLHSNLDDLEGELEATTLELEKTREDLQVKEANKFTFAEYIRTIDSLVKHGQKTACPTCNRSFKSNAEAEELKSDLREQIDKIPTKVKAIKNRLKESEAKKETLWKLRPEKEQMDKLMVEVEEHKAHAQTLDHELKTLERELAEREEQLEALAEKLATCGELREEVFNMDRLNTDVRLLNEKLDELKSRNKDLDEARSMDEFKKEEDLVTRKLTALRREIDTKQAREIEVERSINALEKEMNRLREEKLRIEKQQQEGASLEKRRAELEESVEQIKVEHREREAELAEVRDSIDEARRAKNKLVAEKERSLEAARRETDEAKKMEHDLNVLVGQVRKYEHGSNEARLEQLIRDIDDGNRKKARHEEHAKKLEAERANLEKFVNEQDGRKRQIEDNIRLRKYRQDVQEYQAEMQKFDNQLRLLDYGSVQKRKEELADKVTRLEGKKSSLRGQLEMLQQNIRELERELRSDKFSNAENRYRERSIKHRCRQHVIQDLNKYYKALDFAIMQFHRERMSIINRIVRELWRSVYKGNDIDYIEIKTESSDTSAAGADKRKSYNYRVVMVKNDTEMEMRGRCSAGQKVLASLIIRLALAETFSSNCGIIALDEPTTNLDRDNIESLAEALARIVDRRSTTHNFQLIVITHDEELIETLGRNVQEQNYYYKVRRNDRGLSEVKKFSFGAGTQM